MDTEQKYAELLSQTRKTIGDGRIIAFQPIFRDIGGSITAALMLSQAWYWTNNVLKPSDQGWFDKTEEQWTRETALSREEQRTARNRLMKLGVLEIIRRGVPARIWYRISLETFGSLAQQARDKEANIQLWGKPTTRGGESPQLDVGNGNNKLLGSPRTINTEIPHEIIHEISHEKNMQTSQTLFAGAVSENSDLTKKPKTQRELNLVERKLCEICTLALQVKDLDRFDLRDVKATAKWLVEKLRRNSPGEVCAVLDNYLLYFKSEKQFKPGQYPRAADIKRDWEKYRKWRQNSA